MLLFSYIMLDNKCSCKINYMITCVSGYNVHQNSPKNEEYFIGIVEPVTFLVKEKYDSSKILL